MIKINKKTIAIKKCIWYNIIRKIGKEAKMTSKEALILLLRSHFGDERAKRKVDKYYDEIENQLLTDLDRLEELEKK